MDKNTITNNCSSNFSSQNHRWTSRIIQFQPQLPTSFLFLRVKHLSTVRTASFTLLKSYWALAALPPNCYWEQDPREEAHLSQHFRLPRLLSMSDLTHELPWTKPTEHTTTACQRGRLQAMTLPTKFPACSKCKFSAFFVLQSGQLKLRGGCQWH